MWLTPVHPLLVLLIHVSSVTLLVWGVRVSCAPAVIDRLKEIATEMTKVATEMTKASTLVEDLLKQMSHARAVTVRPSPNVRTLDLTEEVTP